MNSFPPPTGPPAEPPHRRHTGRIVLTLAAALVAIGAIAFSAVSSSDSDEPTAAADDDDHVPATAPDPSAAPSAEDESTTDDGALMPDVMCMNLQDAQDTIQEAGVFFSRSDDATGEGRHQIIDSNWQVVGQIPPPARRSASSRPCSTSSSTANPAPAEPRRCAVFIVIG